MSRDKSDNSWKEISKEVKKEKKEFASLFRKYLKETGMKVEEFQNLYKKEYGDDRYDLQIRLSAYDRHVSLCYVKLLIDNLKEDIDKKKNKLLSAWYKAHKCMNVRDSMVGFYWLSNEQLAWLVNNLDSLLELSEEELIFMTYLQHLTDEGISVLSSKMTHFPKKMLEENKEKINWNIW